MDPAPPGALEAPRLPRPRPQRVTLAGRWVRMEPFDAARHARGLYAASSGPGAAQRHAYLFDDPPRDLAEATRRVEADAAREDPLAFAVVDVADGEALGRQSLMRIEPAHGVVEIGHILWGPAMARSRRATEAFWLAARHVFDTLAYRRLEWKCNAANAPSRAAARRFGFRYEGTFRQHMWIKGRNRDTAWFGMTDGDWQALRPVYAAWLEPANFDAEGRQRRRLGELAAAAGLHGAGDDTPP
ncbi:MAG: GNAT family N-acetyltransferase [Steroidobacteraceae bacterium]|jgi:RimJ/RimL family protein N-acetyltransferase|nr:GNAT family N-acetyltransferase [Steroidobacteraceae bacterium]